MVTKKKGGRLLNYQNERSNNIYLRDTNTGNIYLRGTNTGNSYLRGTNTGNISLSDISLLCLTSGDGLDWRLAKSEAENVRSNY